MTYWEFDQTPGQGWRALADSGDWVGAARAIEGFLACHPGLNDAEKRNLHFHAAQTHALAGEVERALAHLPGAINPTEPADNWLRWNDYVLATEAFLRGDRAGLVAARERIVHGHVGEGADANLPVVDRLIANFGKTDRGRPRSTAGSLRGATLRVGPVSQTSHCAATVTPQSRLGETPGRRPGGRGRPSPTAIRVARSVGRSARWTVRTPWTGGRTRRRKDASLRPARWYSR